MRTMIKKHIDFTNYAQKDLKINANDCSSLAIQCTNLDGALSVTGKNSEANTSVVLYAVSNAFAVVSSITGDGVYLFDISGVDNIELSYSGSAGDIYIKVVD